MMMKRRWRRFILTVKLPKNYLDLMKKPRPDSGITRQSLLER
jgi:hypothetical protein